MPNDPVAGSASTRGSWSGPAGQVLSTEQVAADIRILRVGRPPSFDYRAGQYMKVGVAGRRSGSFSLASSPHDAHLELCVELIPGGRLTPAMFSLTVGDRVVLGERAKGSLRLDTSARTHLLVATVTGIAPLRSLLRQALHDGAPGEFIVLHGASHADELPYAHELGHLATTEQRVTYEPTVSRPGAARNAGWSGATGRVDELATTTAARLDPSTTHVCATGNAGMISNVRAALGARGFRVSTEAFD
ncbi:MAG: FAD-binding oxidoreductase [Microthrixaceae bacterium]